MRRLSSAFLACILAGMALFAQAQPALPTPWPTRQWTSATPASQGLDAAVLADLVNQLARPGLHTDSVILVRNGRVVLESYAAPFRAELRHDLRSVTKTVVAAIVGTAIQEGRIASDQAKVLAFFPEHTPTGHGQQVLTVRHLLDMRTGIEWREWPYDAQSDAVKMLSTPDLTEFILSRPVSEPGERTHYTGAGPHLLSAIVTRSTGRNAADFARGHLFSAVGIEDFSWPSDARGDSIGDSRLRLRTRDLARLGLLYLRDGRWDGRQLLPRGWAESLFTDPGPPHGIDSPILPPTYRSLWWTDGKVPYAAASGRHGQMIVLLPKQDMVLVVTAKTAEDERGANAPDLVRRYLLTAVLGNGAVPGSAASQARLERAIRRFAQREASAFRKPSASALEQARRVYQLEANGPGYREFSLDLAGPQPGYALLQANPAVPTGQRVHGGPLGLDGRFLESSRPDDRLWARRGRWIDERSFRIETQHLEAAVVTEWTARFLRNGELELVYTDGEGESLKIRGRARDPARAALVALPPVHRMGHDGRHAGPKPGATSRSATE